MVTKQTLGSMLLNSNQECWLNTEGVIVFSWVKLGIWPTNFRVGNSAPEGVFCTQAHPWRDLQTIRWLRVHICPLNYLFWIKWAGIKGDYHAYLAKWEFYGYVGGVLRSHSIVNGITSAYCIKRTKAMKVAVLWHTWAYMSAVWVHWAGVPSNHKFVQIGLVWQK